MIAKEHEVVVTAPPEPEILAEVDRLDGARVEGVGEALLRGELCSGATPSRHLQSTTRRIIGALIPREPSCLSRVRCIPDASRTSIHSAPVSMEPLLYLLLGRHPGISALPEPDWASADEQRRSATSDEQRRSTNFTSNGARAKLKCVRRSGPMTEHDRVSAGSQEETRAIGNMPLTRRRFLTGSATVLGGLALGGDALAEGVGAGARRRARSTGHHCDQARRDPDDRKHRQHDRHDGPEQEQQQHGPAARVQLLRHADVLPARLASTSSTDSPSRSSSAPGATVATVRLRKGVTWHNGKPLHGRRPDLHDQPDPRPLRPACRAAQVDQRQGRQEARHAHRPDRAQLRRTRSSPSAGTCRSSRSCPRASTRRNPSGRARSCSRASPRASAASSSEPELLDVAASPTSTSS